jgi:hypothetical protein
MSTTPKRSLRKAINERCRQCTYDPKAGGTARQQIEACTVKVCALWPVRPRAKASEAASTTAEAEDGQ